MKLFHAIFSHITFKFVFKVIFKIKLKKKKKDSKQRHRKIRNSSPSRDTGNLQLYIENFL